MKNKIKEIPWICTQQVITDENNLAKVKGLRVVTTTLECGTLVMYVGSMKLCASMSKQENNEQILVDHLLTYGQQCRDIHTIHDIISGSNMVALNSRRGAGNVILVHPDDYVFHLGIFSVLDAKLSKNFEIHIVNQPTLRGRSIILYRGKNKMGQYDGAPIMAIDEDKCGFVLADSHKYVVVQKFAPDSCQLGVAAKYV